MLTDIVSLELRGDIQIREFAQAVSHFSDLVHDLSEQIAGKGTVEWELAILEYGSPAILEWRGHASDFDNVEKVTGALESIGQNILSGRPIPYGKKISDSATSLLKIPNGKVHTLIVGSNNYKAAFTSDHKSNYVEESEEKSNDFSYGEVVGIADTVTRHTGHIVTIYDELFERAVHCHFRSNQQEQMRDLWGKRVVVTGEVERDKVTSRPLKIRDITNVKLLPANPLGLVGSFERIRGLFSHSPNDELPEVTIRRMRDEQ